MTAEQVIDFIVANRGCRKDDMVKGLGIKPRSVEGYLNDITKRCFLWEDVQDGVTRYYVDYVFENDVSGSHDLYEVLFGEKPQAPEETAYTIHAALRQSLYMSLEDWVIQATGFGRKIEERL